MAESEVKTILKIGGDASEAVKAADQAAQAIDKAAAAQRKAQSTVMAGTSGPTQTESLALEELASREAAAKDELVELNDEQTTGKLKAEAFERALNALNNPLGFLINSANEGTDALKGLLSPTGAGVAGLVAAFTVVRGIISEVNESLRELKSRFDELKQMQAEERARRGERTESTATLLGKAGLTSKEAIMGADQARTQLVQSGASAEAIEKILPFAVDQAGQRTMSDEDLLNLAALAEFQPDAIPGIKRPGDQGRARGRALAQVGRRSADVATFREVMAGRVGRLDTARQELDPAAIARVLEQQGEILPEDPARRQEYIEDVRRVASEGIISSSGVNAAYNPAREAWALRQRRAVAGAQAAGLISGEQSERFAKKTFWDADAYLLNYQGMGFFKAKSAKHEQGEIQPMQTQGAAPATVHHYHGPVYQGSEGSQFARVPRQ